MNIPKAAVKRTLDYMLTEKIQGAIKAQSVTRKKACQYAGVSYATISKLYKSPTAYFPQALRLMRCLGVPIDEVREMICYPW